MIFHENCSKCIKLSHERQYAERVGDGYDHGVVFSRKPLQIEKEEIFQLKIESTVTKWAGSLVSVRDFIFCLSSSYPLSLFQDNLLLTFNLCCIVCIKGKLY